MQAYYRNKDGGAVTQEWEFRRVVMVCSILLQVHSSNINHLQQVDPKTKFTKLGAQINICVVHLCFAEATIWKRLRMTSNGGEHLGFIRFFAIVHIVILLTHKLFALHDVDYKKIWVFSVTSIGLGLY